MKVTLQVDGVEMTSSEEELIAILKEHFNKAKPERQEKPKHEPTKSILRPTEGVPFEVNPPGIYRISFECKRKDEQQEKTRQLILKAFAEVDENPERYGKPFKTLMPVKTWNYKTVGELRELAAKLGDHNANWVEQALEWAQRIQNGETWEAICNEPDTANWYRLIEWKNGYTRLVGGSRKSNNHFPASDVSYDVCNANHTCSSRSITVPLVVLYAL